MTQPRPTIALSTRTLGRHTGVSAAALDVLLALSRTDHDVTVRAWVPHALPSAVDGIALGPSRFEGLVPYAVARSVLSGDAPPRSLPEQLRLLVQDRLPSSLPLPLPIVRPRDNQPRSDRVVLEVVNGLGAHGVYLAARARASSAANTPSLLVVHESPRHFAAGARLSVEEALQIVQSYDYRVFVSERGMREWNELGSLDAARSFYIPNCVREQETHRLLARDRKDVRSMLGYSTDVLQVVCVGAVIQRKGQDIVLDALAQLAETHPQVRVDFLGPLQDGWAESLKARLARSAELGARARFLGSVNDVYERIYAADALVLASRAEAFPLSVLEAMALATCVVASDVDGIGEQVVHDESGLLFPREDVQALAACLRLVADDPVRRKTLARAARSRYVSEFNRTRQLERWAEAIDQILSRKVGRATA
ncbi:MAG TPA: glycosyltransferase family 4 protein [Polyangiales bacterium]|nr:glycosyltransferase family 4 protein [Polyangiales bacterium]